MKIAILGFGDQGKSAYEYWHKPDNQITICDSNSELVLPDDVQKQLGPDYLKNLDQFDLIVRSPGVHPKEITKTNPGTENKITTVTNEFFRVCPTKNIIGVTGTKGKGTTSTLITKILEASGKQVHLGGNIGTPPLEMLKENIQPEDWVVLELANFQLIDLKYSPKIAVCLMVTPEHQDWHEDFEEYATAKQQLFRWQKHSDIAIYFSPDENSEKITSVSTGHKIPYFSPPGAYVENNIITINDQKVLKTDEIKLLGEHNWQNVCAAVTTVWQITQNIEAMRSIIASFSGLEHRLELVRELDDIKYYDDSFGTTPETTIVAIKAFTQPKVLILGGSDKGADYAELAKTIKESNVRCALLIGDQAPRIQAALEAAGFTDFVAGEDTMTKIVDKARQAAQAGDVVLLSTACASFDMFKNYQDRGQQFVTAVKSLA